MLRKITKTRGHFPNDDAAIKLLYLGIRNIDTKHGGPTGTGTTGWKRALNAFAIHHPGRLPIEGQRPAPHTNKLTPALTVPGRFDVSQSVRAEQAATATDSASLRSGVSTASRRRSRPRAQRAWPAHARRSRPPRPTTREEIAETARRLDRPRPRLVRLRPRHQLLDLPAAGPHLLTVEFSLATADSNRGVRRLVRVNPDDHCH